MGSSENADKQEYSQNCYPAQNPYADNSKELIYNTPGRFENATKKIQAEFETNEKSEKTPSSFKRNSNFTSNRLNPDHDRANPIYQGHLNRLCAHFAKK